MVAINKDVAWYKPRDTVYFMLHAAILVICENVIAVSITHFVKKSTLWHIFWHTIKIASLRMQRDLHIFRHFCIRFASEWSTRFKKMSFAANRYPSRCVSRHREAKAIHERIHQELNQFHQSHDCCCCCLIYRARLLLLLLVMLQLVTSLCIQQP